jgi:chaperone BCS1
MGGVIGMLSMELQRQGMNGLPGMQMGLVNAMRTGSPLLDLLLCMVIPIVIGALAKGLPMINGLSLPSGWRWKFWIPLHLRSIEYVEGGSMRQNYLAQALGLETDLGCTDRNNLLQKAIRLYLASKYAVDSKNMEVTLTPGWKSGAGPEGQKSEGGLSSRRSPNFTGSYSQLESFVISAFPRKGEWVVVDEEKGIEFMQQKLEEDKKDAQGNAQNGKCTTVYCLRAYGADASSRVDAWVNEAFAWYKEMRRADETNKKRYLFTAMRPPLGASKEEEKQLTFKQYLLGDHKSFKSLFFPEKDAMLELVDDFLAKRGKFAIDGYPNKLGLLLDGPPGTGKTSLIKALATYTNRHVVSINLAKVKTNQELMDLFFDLVFPVKGAEFPLTLGFDNLIFVMEDIDAASKVVFARKPKKDSKSKSDGSLTPDQSPQLPEAGPDESDDEAHQGDTPTVVESLVQCLTQTATVATSDGECVKVGPSGWGKDEDALNLAGLLNVLDGVVDSPGRILVMTSNHPEKLDPALIRPGRISKRIHLGGMTAESMVGMVEHYHATTLTEAQTAELRDIAGLTPARVEQCCAEADSFEALVRLLSSE